jgi:hypothetical protein
MTSTQALSHADHVSAFLGDRTPVLAVTFGSAIYGTATPQSDTDLRAVFLPTPEEILTGQVNFGSEGNEDHRRMSAGDLDVAGYSLMRFLGLMGRMDMLAVEVLFASRYEQFRVCLSSDVADAVWKARDLLVAGTASAAIGHASKRLGPLLPETDKSLDVFRTALDLVSKCTGDHLCDHPDVLDALSKTPGIRVYASYARSSRPNVEWSDLTEAERQAGRVPLGTVYVQVYNKRLTATAATADSLRVLRRPLDRAETGKRAREEGLSLNWKDVSHAIRLLNQARDFHVTRELVFPRPDAPLLRKLRAGEMPLQAVSELASELLDDLRRLEVEFPFRPEACAETQTELTVRAHHAAVKNRF